MQILDPIAHTPHYGSGLLRQRLTAPKHYLYTWIERIFTTTLADERKGERGRGSPPTRLSRGRPETVPSYRLWSSLDDSTEREGKWREGEDRPVKNSPYSSTFFYRYIDYTHKRIFSRQYLRDFLQWKYNVWKICEKWSKKGCFKS